VEASFAELRESLPFQDGLRPLSPPPAGATPEGLRRKRIYKDDRRVTRRHPITDHRKPICLGSEWAWCSDRRLIV